MGWGGMGLRDASKAHVFLHTYRLSKTKDVQALCSYLLLCSLTHTLSASGLDRISVKKKKKRFSMATAVAALRL